MMGDVQIRPGVAAVVWDTQGRLLLHHRHVGGGWAPPSGSVKAAESVHDAIHRELGEETAMSVAVHRLIGVYSDPVFQIVDFPDDGRVHFVTCLFDCQVTAGALQGSGEADRWEWFAPAALPEDLLPYARVWLEDTLASRAHVIVR